MKKLLTFCLFSFLFLPVKAAIFGPNIHSQNVLQNGTTAYPQFLYVGSSVTLPTTTISSMTITSSATIAGLTLSNNANGNNFKFTNLSSGTFNSDSARYSQVKYLGWQQFTTTASTQTTAPAFVLSNLTLSVTPKSVQDSIRLSMSSVLGSSNFAGNNCEVTFERNGVNLLSADGFASASGATGATQVPVSGLFIDNPSTTSAVTYAVYFRVATGGGITCTLQAGGTVTGIFIAEDLNGL